MPTIHRVSAGTLAALLFVLVSSCTSSKPNSGSEPVGSSRSLLVISADNATVEATDGGRVVIKLTGVNPAAVSVADEPSMQAKSVSLAELASHWGERFGSRAPQAALLAEDITVNPATGARPPETADSEVARDSLVVTIDGFSARNDELTVSARPGPPPQPGSALEGLAESDAGVTGTTVMKDASLLVDVSGSPSAASSPVAARFRALDSSSSTPHIAAVKAKLMKTNPTSEGIAWSETTGNSLPGTGADSWLLQTPECWGKSSCTTDSFKRFEDALRSMTSRAETIVDLTTLYPYPDGLFRQALVDGLASTYKAGRRPLIRITAGVPPTYSMGGTTAKEWRNAFASDIATAAGYNSDIVKVAVASVATSWGWSWNHSKIVAVDGKEAVIGGQNFLTADFFQTDNPISDVSIHHRGPVATEAHNFVDTQWGFICANTGSFLNVDYQPGSNVKECPATHPSSGTSAPVGDVAMLSVGRLGMGIANARVDSGPLPDDLVSRSDANAIACSWLTDDYTNRSASYERSNPGEPALRELIASATDSITLTQQDLIGICSAKIPPKWDVRVFDALADRIAHGVTVRVVVSSPGKWDYSNGGTLADISAYLLSRVQRIVPGESGKKLFCERAAVAPIRVNESSETWPNGKPIGNHTKVVAVDKAAFYVGSENLYPAWLQEYGVIVEDPAAATTFYSDLLDPMWKQAERAKDTSQCA